MPSITQKQIKQKFYELLREIPRGKITTYKIIAKKLKIHPRTAGIFLSKNKYPKKYPCYKVIKSDGGLGGYSGAGGVKKKIELLKREGVEIKRGKVIELEKNFIDFNSFIDKRSYKVFNKDSYLYYFFIFKMSEKQIITKEQIKKTAQLARINLTEEEEEKFTEEIGAVLDCFKSINEIETQEREKIDHYNLKKNQLRKDKDREKDEGKKENIRKQFPKRKDDYLDVKAVL